MFLLVLLSSLLGCTNDYLGAMEDPKPAAEVIEVKDFNGSVDVSAGIYDLEYYVRGTDSATLVVSAGGKRSATMLDADVWHRGFVRGITATGNKLQVSGTLLDASASFELKAAYLRKAEHTRTFIKGGQPASWMRLYGLHHRFPIPQEYIDESKSAITQTPGY